jgi:hypothetical protein
LFLALELFGLLPAQSFFQFSDLLSVFLFELELLEGSLLIHCLHLFVHHVHPVGDFLIFAGRGLLLLPQQKLQFVQHIVLLSHFCVLFAKLLLEHLLHGRYRRGQRP